MIFEYTNGKAKPKVIDTSIDTKHKCRSNEIKKNESASLWVRPWGTGLIISTFDLGVML